MSDNQWYVAVDGKSIGPMSETELIEAFRTGQYGPDHHVFREGMKGWIPAHGAEEFKDALPPRASTPPPPAMGNGERSRLL